MKAKLKSDNVLFDPILAEVYRIRDAYARRFNFDVDAICDALPAARAPRRAPRSSVPRAIAMSQAGSRAKRRPRGVAR